MVEQGTHKPLVGGSNPPAATTRYSGLAAYILDVVLVCSDNPVRPLTDAVMMPSRCCHDAVSLPKTKACQYLDLAG